MAERATYESPEVVEYGDIKEITRGAPGTDAMDNPLGVVPIGGTEEDVNGS